MIWTNLATPLAGLLGVVLGSLLTSRQAAAARRAELDRLDAANHRAEEQSAVLELLAASQLIGQRANGFRIAVKLLQSWGARRHRRRGIIAPLDADAIFDRLVDGEQALAKASAKVSLTAETEAVRLATSLTLAAAELFGSYQDKPQPGIRSTMRSLALAYSTTLPGDEMRIREAHQALARASDDLTEYVRSKYGLEVILLEPDGQGAQ